MSFTKTGDWAVRCCIILFCLFCSSCKKQILYKQKDIEVLVDDNKQKYLDYIIQQEAMLVDIPIPLFDERIIPSSLDDIKSDTLLFGYKSPLSKDQIIDFFLNQMERLGWKHLVSFESVETLLEFKSPDRYCTIIIKPCSSTSITCIFMYIKKRASIELALK